MTILKTLAIAIALVATLTPAIADGFTPGKAVTDNELWGMAASRAYQVVCVPAVRLSPESLELQHRLEMTVPYEHTAPITADVAEQAKDKETFCLKGNALGLALMIKASNEIAPSVLRTLCLAKKSFPPGHVHDQGDYVLVRCAPPLRWYGSQLGW
jgi:hypothetical protein